MDIFFLWGLAKSLSECHTRLYKLVRCWKNRSFYSFILCVVCIYVSYMFVYSVGRYLLIFITAQWCKWVIQRWKSCFIFFLEKKKRNQEKTRDPPEIDCTYFDWCTPHTSWNQLFFTWNLHAGFFDFYF